MPTHAQHLQQRTGTRGPCEQAMPACESLLFSWEHALEPAFSAKFCAHPEGTSSCLHLYTKQLQQAVTAYRSWTMLCPIQALRKHTRSGKRPCTIRLTAWEQVLSIRHVSDQHAGLMVDAQVQFLQQT